MPYHYNCPSCAQLIGGDEQYVGAQVQCPLCHQVIVQPGPPGYEAAPSFGMPDAGASPGLGGFDTLGGSQSLDPLTQPDGTVHVICRHCRKILPTPTSMLGQDAMCPYCDQVITLHKEDTVEYRKQKEDYLRMKHERMSRKAMNIAIAAVVIVALGFLVMIVLYFASRK
jgi:DNA-directed RNA polymerase subunit RPC12/RpoP